MILFIIVNNIHFKNELLIKRHLLRREMSKYVIFMYLVLQYLFL
jgi:hypothetical protein